MTDSMQAGLTTESLRTKVRDAHDFHTHFLQTSQTDHGALHVRHMPGWGAKFLRRSGSRSRAILEKLGANSIAKRRPDNLAPFLDYIAQRDAQKAPLRLRLVVGPVKNVQRLGPHQQPDLAEYLMFIQLARVMEAIAPFYPYGIQVQLVPDDLRGQAANHWPSAYSRQYIAGLQAMVQDLGFDAWLDVEAGQARLYDEYHVHAYRNAARDAVLCDPDHAWHLAKACRNAERNYIAPLGAARSEEAVRDSALRYLISHQAEILSGMWSPSAALPLIYAHHPNHYQLYTMGQGITKLPWQIALPMALLESEEQPILARRFGA